MAIWPQKSRGSGTQQDLEASPEHNLLVGSDSCSKLQSAGHSLPVTQALCLQKRVYSFWGNLPPWEPGLREEHGTVRSQKAEPPMLGHVGEAGFTEEVTFKSLFEEQGEEGSSGRSQKYGSKA